jgi:regulator of sigma D
LNLSNDKQYCHYFKTIRRVLYSGFLLPAIILIYFSSCGHSKDKTNTPKSLQESFDKVYDLYKQIGYNELDPIGKTFNRLDQIVDYFDSVAVKPPDYSTIVAKKNQLSGYITAFNEFHEEIYIVEDNLLSLESSFRVGKISEEELSKRIKLESSLLENISNRISEMRKKVDLTILSIDGLNINESFP